jgi:DNA-directed RNA polymerase subunit RPC12/RpoP
MAEPTIVQCPKCQARLKVAVTGKPAARCPKCGATVPLKGKPAEPTEEDEERAAPTPRASRVRDEEDEDDRPVRAAKRRPRHEEEEDEEERPARAARRRSRYEEEDDDEDEEDRPRRKKKGRKEKTPGPWPVALGVFLGMIVLGFAMGYLLFGTQGLPKPEDGRMATKYVGLGFMLFLSLILALIGIFGVKDRHISGKWGIEYRGGTAVVIGFVQSAVSGGLLGFSTYGLIF